MHLTDSIKEKILSEYNQFRESLYAGKSLEQRREMDQFFTPPELTIQMIEKFDCESLAEKRILDPCCGSGNLLAACLIAGANPENIFGNELDADMVSLCKKRLNNICDNLNLSHVPDCNIHQGDALSRDALTNFSSKYKMPVIVNYEKETLW